MKKLFTIGFLIIGVCVNAQKVYLAKNGVTVKASADALVGSEGVLNGIGYVIVDLTTLKAMIRNGDDVTKVVTTKITNI